MRSCFVAGVLAFSACTRSLSPAENIARTDAGQDSGRSGCTSDGQCPSGTLCDISGQCVAPLLTADAGSDNSDAGSGDGGTGTGDSDAGSGDGGADSGAPDAGSSGRDAGPADAGADSYGVCGLGDGCDPATQNCPDLPLDRSQPVSASNPAIAQTCLPVLAGGEFVTDGGYPVYGCFPAGPVPFEGACLQDCSDIGSTIAGTECAYTCSDTSASCTVNSVCVGYGFADGGFIFRCQEFCDTPTNNPMDSAGCPANEYCTASPFGSPICSPVF